MAVSARKLDAIGLSPPVQSDEAVASNSYTRRLELQIAIKADTQNYKPTGDDFFNTKVQTNKATARCNMPCHTVTCSATVIGGGASGDNKVLNGITYFIKKE